MDSQTLTCTMITPMFSYGANPYQPELRAAQVKGLLRYMYRIATPITDLDALRSAESALFGGAANNNSGNASPIRLMVSPVNVAQTKAKLLLHEEKAAKRPMTCFQEKSTFAIDLRFNGALASNPAANLEWYTDLLVLSLLLGGLGKRSRKGRGSVSVQEHPFSNSAKAMTWICQALNQVANLSSNHNSPAFILKADKNQISLNSQLAIKLRKAPLRPVITDIQLGRKLKPAQIDPYLKALDTACHETKKNAKNFYERAATGIAERSKLASPLIISLIYIGDSVYPLYTFVQAVLNRCVIDQNNRDRNAFITQLYSLMSSPQPKPQGR